MTTPHADPRDPTLPPPEPVRPDFRIWQTEDAWPDYEGCDRCPRCDYHLASHECMDDACPNCGFDGLWEMGYPHCEECGKVIVGTVMTDQDDNDYHPSCADNVLAEHEEALDAYRAARRAERGDIALRPTQQA